MTKNHDGLLYACFLDGHGSGRTCSWDDVRAFDTKNPDAEVLWAHLDRRHETTRQYILKEAGLPTTSAQAMITEDTRPRADWHGSNAMIILRGVNMNPGSQPDDMISIRMWVEPKRIITLRYPRFQTISDIRQAIDEGTGPTSPGSFLASVSAGLADYIEQVVNNLQDQVDLVEETALTDESSQPRNVLLGLRQQIVTLRRYLGPQRDALRQITTHATSWITEDERLELVETTDRTTRYVEDLEALRERAALIYDEMTSRLSDRMNQTMYLLSMVATIFLPLGLLTGLLGINVGGMPGTNSPMAFWCVCVILVGLTVFGVLYVKWRKWL